MSVYFMQPISGGPVKIGHSIDVDRRREQLEALYGQRLVVLAVADGGINEERAVHDRFSHLRLGKTEQFRPDLELMQFIGRPLLADMNSDAVEAMPRRGQVILISYKADERTADEFKRWLEELAKDIGAPVSVTIDIALNALAKSRKLRPMPNRLVK